MMEATQRTPARVGGGVIGAGWAARFLLLNGIDVAIFDPDPEAERARRGARQRRARLGG
jgi:carnitine 3-dehydrogenase